MSSVSAIDAPLAAEIDAILDVAVSSAREAGALIRANSGLTAADEKGGHQDLVTLIDRACQNVVERAIATSFPTHKILGEENVAPGRAASIAATRAALAGEPRWLWIIDPIDGTTNFVCGIPMSVVSIAIAFKGEVVAAVIFEPFRDELFTAAKGRGALLNGTAIRVNESAELRRGVFGLGTHNNPIVGKVMVRVMDVMVERVRGLRALGSACLALAYVACGRLSGYFEQDLNAWDNAAGFLLIVEAGGVVTDMAGRAYSIETRDICGTCGKGDLHGEILAAIAAAGAESSVDTYRNTLA